MIPERSGNCGPSDSERDSSGTLQMDTNNNTLVVRKPEPGSFRYLIVTNPSKRLYVRPELWTAETLQLMECIVQPLIQISSTGSDSKNEFSGIIYRSSINSAENRRAASSYLAFRRTKSVAYKDRVIRDLMSYFVQLADVPKRYVVDLYCRRLPLYFGQKPVAFLRCPFLVRELTTSRLVCAFIDRTWVLNDGRVYFRARRAKKHRWKAPVASHNLENPIDPYYVAIMIAMAQGSLEGPTQATQSIRSITLLTLSTDQKDLILYTAEVKPEFLNKFAHPYERSDCPLVISEERIPMLPTMIAVAMARILEKNKPFEIDGQEESLSKRTDSMDDGDLGPDPSSSRKPTLSDGANSSENVNLGLPPFKRQRTDS